MCFSTCVWRDVMLTLAGSPFLLYMLSVRREDPDHSRPQLLTSTHDLSAIPGTHKHTHYTLTYAQIGVFGNFEKKKILFY